MDFGFGIFIGFLLCILCAALFGGSTTSNTNQCGHKHFFSRWKPTSDGKGQYRECYDCGWVEKATFDSQEKDSKQK